jgi:hypothetical protein
MAERMSWSVSGIDGALRVVLRGAIDEDADFAALANDLRGHSAIHFDLEGVNRVNSCGVREWVNFLRSLAPSSAIQFERCNPSVVSQMNMIPNFKGAARVLSVIAPYTCGSCGQVKSIVLELTGTQRPTLESVVCPKCSSPMEFDDIEDSYFAFMR